MMIRVEGAISALRSGGGESVHSTGSVFDSTQLDSARGGFAGGNLDGRGDDGHGFRLRECEVR